MIIRYIICDNIEELLNIVLRPLIRKNINYIVIKDELFVELHFDKYIYRIIPFEFKNEILQSFSMFNVSNEKELDFLKEYNYKEKSGYKRYTKKDIKRGNVKLPNSYRMYKR